MADWWSLEDLRTQVHGPLWGTICYKTQVRLLQDGHSMLDVVLWFRAKFPGFVFANHGGHTMESYYETLPHDDSKESFLVIASQRIHGKDDL